MSSNVQAENRRGGIVSILGGTIVSIAVTMILILLFALLIRFTNISDSVIFPVNQIIKIVSIFIGMVILQKKNKSRGFLKGMLLGLLYFLFSYIIFSILQAKFTFELKNLYDLILTTLMGGLIGIIVVNIGKN